MKNKAAGCQAGDNNRSIEGKITNPHARFILPIEKIPPEGFTEESALSGISKFEKRAVLRKLRDSVRWQRLRRCVIRGVAWYCPMEAQ